MSDPESDKEKFNGSLIVVEAESAAAVRAILEKDIFWTNNVVSPSIDPTVLPSLPPLCSSFRSYFALSFFCAWFGGYS